MLLSAPAMARKTRSNSQRGGPCVEMERVLSSTVAAISPFVDNLQLLINQCRCAPGNEADIDIALREALQNGVIHGNHEDPCKYVYVGAAAKLRRKFPSFEDEREGFDSNALPGPTVPGALELNHGRRIYLVKAVIIRFASDKLAPVVHMRQPSDNSRPNPAKELR